MEVTILNSKGQPILLNEQEKKMANHYQVILNSLGFEIPITTLTTIMKKVSEQKFFRIAPADYLPVRVGEGAWSTNLLTYLASFLGGKFAEGLVNTGGNNGRLATADAGISGISVKVNNWAKAIGWTIMELQQATKAGNWDLVTSKEKARKIDWDLGIQKVAFLGIDGDEETLGFYTQPDVTINTTLIQEPISEMDATEMSAFLAGLLEAYRNNCSRTAWPTSFVMPESDYLGMGVPYSSTFPNVSKLDYMLNLLKVMTMNPNFKILPNAYGDAQYSGLDNNRYVFSNYDEESLRMDIPVDYTNTLANSIDGFSFQNAGYGQFTGAKAYRPKEMLYFDVAP